MHGSPEAKKLIHSYRDVRLLIEDSQEQAHVAAAMRTPFQQGDQVERERKGSDEGPSCSSMPCPPAITNMAFPISMADREAWGMFDELPPYTEESPPLPVQPTAPPEKAPITSTAPIAPTAPSAPTAPTAPPVEASAASPMEVDPVNVSLPCDSGLNLEGHARLMTHLLEEMKRLDPGLKRSEVKIAYKKAHDAIVNGLNNIATQLDEMEANDKKGLNPAVLQDRRLWVLERMKAREWTFAEADNFLQSKYGPSAAISEEEKIRFGGNQGTEKEAGDGLTSSFFKAFQNPERKKTEEILPPRDLFL